MRYDLLLAPAATGEAPRGLEYTGDPVFNRVWTMLRVPCVAIPAGRGPHGLPVGVQLIGHHGGDRDLLAAARRVVRALAPDRGIASMPPS